MAIEDQTDGQYPVAEEILKLPQKQGRKHHRKKQGILLDCRTDGVGKEASGRKARLTIKQKAYLTTSYGACIVSSLALLKEFLRTPDTCGEFTPALRERLQTARFFVNKFFPDAPREDVTPDTSPSGLPASLIRLLVEPAMGAAVSVEDGTLSGQGEAGLLGNDGGGMQNPLT